MQFGLRLLGLRTAFWVDKRLKFTDHNRCARNTTQMIFPRLRLAALTYVRWP